MPEGDSLLDDGTSAEVPESEAVETEAEKTVPASRFNGLQRTVTQLQKELAAAKAAVPPPPPTPPAASPADDAMAEMYREWQELKLERARDAAVRDYPTVAPLRDYLVGADEQSIKDLAKEIAGKLAPPAEGETQTSTVPYAPPIGAGATPLPNATPQDQVDDAVKKKDWSSFLNAISNRAGR